MTPERLEIARRMVACKGWVWLPGMHVVPVRGEHMDEPERIVDQIEAAYVNRGDGLPCIPDLDDDLTRLGVLAVVRRAWGDDSIGVVRMSDGWHVTRGMILGSWIATIVGGAPTEEGALQAALQVAPQ
jgi:hypothetical protein